MKRRTFSAVIVAAVLAFPLGLNLALPQSAMAANGSFVGVEGESVSGSASVTNGKVTLSSNFRSSSGPDLYVYLGNGRPSRIIGRLRKLSGGQTYKIPSGVDPKDYSAVFIHCKRYNHTFGKAALR